MAPDGGAALRAWPAAPLVLVGADLAAEVGRDPAAAPAGRARRRAGARCPTSCSAPRSRWAPRASPSCPRRRPWLVEALDRPRRRPPGPRADVIGVVGGSGGAGATTFACALGQVAARRGRPWSSTSTRSGPGSTGCSASRRATGVRWDALCQTTGRLSARSLREALPRRGGLGGAHLGRRAAPAASRPFAVREALSAAQRGHDTVVVDLPRPRDPLVEEVAARCDRCWSWSSPTVAGVASAARVCAGCPDRSRVRLVVRGERASTPADVARATGVPVLAEMSDQRGLAESIDLGLGPVRSRRGPLGRAAPRCSTRLALGRGRAA